MMRFLPALLLAFSAGAVSAAPQPRFSPNEDVEQLIDKLIKNPPRLSASRLPQGFRTGHCLLVVEGKTSISGRCAYRIDKGGDFLINGPRQIYDGIDYPDAHGSIAAMVSTDYWATVFREEDGTWDGYGNDDISGVKGEGPNFGPLRQQGPCFVGKEARICLWKK